MVDPAGRAGLSVGPLLRALSFDHHLTGSSPLPAPPGAVETEPVTRADFVKTFGGVILGWILGFSSALGVQRWTEAKQVRNLARLLEVELEHNIRFLSMYAKIDPTTIVDQGQSIPLDRTTFPEGSEFRTGVFSATLNSTQWSGQPPEGGPCAAPGVLLADRPDRPASPQRIQ